MPRAASFARDDRAISFERPVVWLVVLAVTVAVVGSVVLVAEDVRRETPDAEFAVTFDEETGTVTVEHAGGEAITDRVTQRLTVVVTDESVGEATDIVWASDLSGPTVRGEGYPVAPGDTLTIDDPTVDADGDENVLDADASVGFDISSEDSVSVVWVGNRQGGPPRTVTLTNATVG